MPEFRRILITGAAGSLGSHLGPASRRSPSGCGSPTSPTSGKPPRTRSWCDATSLTAKPRST